MNSDPNETEPDGRVESSGLEAESEPKSNPYSPPSVDGEPGEMEINGPPDLSEDCFGNLRLTARIVMMATIFFFVVAALYLLSTIVAFNRYLDLHLGWTWSHTLYAYQLLNALSFVVLGWMGLNYFVAIRRFSNGGLKEMERYVEKQAYFWLAVFLALFVYFVGVGLTYLAWYLPLWQ